MMKYRITLVLSIFFVSLVSLLHASEHDFRRETKKSYKPSASVIDPSDVSEDSLDLDSETDKKSRRRLKTKAELKKTDRSAQESEEKRRPKKRARTDPSPPEESEPSEDEGILALADVASLDEKEEESVEEKQPSRASRKSDKSKAEKKAIKRAYDEDRKTRVLPTFSPHALAFKDDSDEEGNPNDYHQFYLTR